MITSAESHFIAMDVSLKSGETSLSFCHGGFFNNPVETIDGPTSGEELEGLREWIHCVFR